MRAFSKGSLNLTTLQTLGERYRNQNMQSKINIIKKKILVQANKPSWNILGSKHC